ncbi:transcriptional regulator GutM [Sporanaerobacter sp. PP17-6a]|uniref:transcriptional regulator GutM n=1 Tax=Sporanaerobacter sp. PP17-6a TaxID=1891289 RepID=UPI00089FCCEE|nr:transcriptional regulator GutM [Sporanaerobacter sp. PP17-6a]SCL86880.1 DNA-binding transcriptional activator GutM [Sporanaerobacter sp. PP17-6a]
MNDFSFIVLFSALGLFWIIQGIFTYYQMKNVKRNYQDICKNYDKGYFFGMGNKKGILSRGYIVFLVAKKNGEIVQGKILGGVSVFNRFKNYDEIIGKNIYNYKPDSTTSKYKAVIMAIENIKNYIEEKKIETKEC